MEFTLSSHATTTIRERNIRAEWIAATLSAPAATESDPNDPTLTHALRVIPEYGDRVLRVIYNRSRQPPYVVTAFFDRGMKGKL
ncbi:MAG: hypothetical protein CVU18_15485 [Betaproteobacteria bacterium HGW-Betaproteobacteria-12]|nr:MAG: hypothetical protein CVU18_15485 [Betaproteobacteria bacterium HGW-Betaproteobacteria-12]